ncbi:MULTISPECIES: phosphotransferase family protein [Brevibacillus]|uniref:Aminoglycoside phosphotransferase n=1 Tax=Brevibacillus parabrevis TaxID=54914 RepID=A0A4Y3PWK1_BREPA|nr:MULTISPECIES: phosphotransferase [Brevibacillus]NRQ56404.1 phosphotransferase [Brevibacillus sp. HD1.4A]MBU8716154.1 phosphotransferase [Brevibacillus parabrevis]MDH6353366.1 aminoglycoside 2''-phosphotransferase [Brevibacillus sp. 1238]MDR5001607.1 phosphotransferase [Brevibacillus parabrevis]MED2253471.1 phosphotransferase [Brevibacillus parabrevis]
MQLEPLRKLLQDRYPELRNETFRVDDTGWSNFVVIVGEKMIFRFPKTEEAKAIISREMQILPLLGPMVPVAIPQFVYSSTQTDDIKYVGYPMIYGKPLFREEMSGLSDKEQEQVAKAIGGFLSGLHSYPLEKSFDKAIDPALTKAFYENLLKRIERKAFSYMPLELQQWTRQTFQAFVANPDYFAFKPALLHNDLKPEHLLYDFEKRRLNGIIDFGAMGVGDPAYDFVGIYRAYGAAFAHKVLSYYTRETDPVFFDRITSFYVKTISFWTLFYGIDCQNQKLIQYALGKLQAFARAKGT